MSDFEQRQRAVGNHFIQLQNRKNGNVNGCNQNENVPIYAESGHFAVLGSFPPIE